MTWIQLDRIHAQYFEIDQVLSNIPLGIQFVGLYIDMKYLCILVLKYTQINVFSTGNMNICLNNV